MLSKNFKEENYDNTTQELSYGVKLLTTTAFLHISYDLL